jgi:Ca-activated chloride channel family protein
MKLKFCHIVILGIVLGSLSGCGIPGSQKTSGYSKNQVENTATKKKAAAPEPALPNDIISETEQEIVAGHDQTNDVTVEKSRRSQRDELRAKENKSIPGLAKPGLPKQKAEMPALANSFRTAPFPTPSEQTILLPSEPVDRENYAHLDDNPLKRVAENPVSTFSIDVDTGSYANVRRLLKAGRLPVKDAVRVEEMINYFDYAYSAPKSKSKPFNIITEVGPAPWSKDTYLLHIGIKGYDVPRENMPAANLVFLVDVSGSMQSADKLDLLKNALKLLVNKLRPQDHVALVVYAGASGVVLEPTSGKDRLKIITALDSLTAGGSTNGGAGIRLAYAQAEQGFIPGGINRVLLATDGDFNVGTVNFEALKNLVEEKGINRSAGKCFC